MDVPDADRVERLLELKTYLEARLAEARDEARGFERRVAELEAELLVARRSHARLYDEHVRGDPEAEAAHHAALTAEVYPPAQ